MKVKNLTRVLSVALTLAFLAAFPPFAAVAQTFGDVVEGDWGKYTWAFEAVDYLSNEGIIGGRPDGTFGPGGKILRMEMAVVMCKATGDADKDSALLIPENGFSYAVSKGWMLPGDPSAYLTRQETALAVAYLVDIYDPNAVLSDFDGFYDSYSDYDQIDEDYLLAVGFGTHIGVINGRPDGLFDPGGEIIRAELAVVLHRALTWENSWQFFDVPPSHWAHEAVEYLYAEGIVNGRFGNVFDPLGGTTRAEMAVLMCRRLKQIKFEPP